MVRPRLTVPRYTHRKRTCGELHGMLYELLVSETVCYLERSTTLNEALKHLQRVGIEAHNITMKAAAVISSTIFDIIFRSMQTVSYTNKLKAATQNVR